MICSRSSGFMSSPKKVSLMNPYIFFCLNFVLPKYFGLEMPLTVQEAGQPLPAGEAVKIGGRRLLGTGDARQGLAAEVVATGAVLIEQSRALGLGVRAEQRQCAADGDLLRRLGKLLHPLGLPAAFFERGLILLVPGIAGIRPPGEHPQTAKHEEGQGDIQRPAGRVPADVRHGEKQQHGQPRDDEDRDHLRPSAERLVKLVEAAERPLGPGRAGIVDGIGRGAQFDAGLRTA